MALQIRVMMSHARPRTSAASDDRSAKRRRIHPFVHFREQEQSDDDTDQPKVVVASFNGTDAEQLLDDGSTRTASKYEKGADGFVLATFADGTTLTTEAPNSLLVDGEIKPMALPKNRVSRKPAAAAPSAQPAAAPAAGQKMRLAIRTAMGKAFVVIMTTGQKRYKQVCEISQKKMSQEVGVIAQEVVDELRADLDALNVETAEDIDPATFAAFKLKAAAIKAAYII